ncbi:MAG: hypothetical protein H7A55_00610 [Verrucomicrobiaceae bacterium]|nr:hypothetical protein [Verrucomicrobiaceae bacterium]
MRLHFALSAFSLVVVAAFSQQAPLLPVSDQGTWKAPPSGGRAWRQVETGLMFPNQLETFQLKGVLDYKDEDGHLLRYDSAAERARADIFIFKHDGASTTELDRKNAIAQEMAHVRENLSQMELSGDYKNVVQEEELTGDIPLWKKDPVPILVKTISATKILKGVDGATEGAVKIWTGVTFFEGYLVTLRHTRPADTGQGGEVAMKEFVQRFFQIIRDPSLRVEMEPMLAEYFQSPLSPAGDEAATVLLGYLKETALPISMPAPPITTWAEAAEKVVPGTGTHLLRAFVLGSAKAALDDKEATACLDAATVQFVKIYREIKQTYPGLQTPEIEELGKAVDKGEGGAWLLKKTVVQ